MFDFDELPDRSDGEDDAPAPAPAPKVQPAPLGRKVRILALHGGGANTNIMKYQTANLRQQLGDAAEWDFLNGTRPWSYDPGEPMQLLADGMPFYGWYGVSDDGDPRRAYLDRLFDPSVTFTYNDVDAVIDRVWKRIQEQGPYDVICAFSQGCVVAHLLAGFLRARGEALPWRLSVLFNGVCVRDARYRSLFDTPLSVPAVFILGRRDEFYEYGKKQVEMYEDHTVLEHDEGHKFPNSRPRSKEVYDAVIKKIQWHSGLQSAPS